MRGCAYPSCPKLAVAGKCYCKEHMTEDYRWYEKYSRTKEERARYGYRWRKIRDRFIKEHPLCFRCLEKGEAELATEVHHIIPLDHGGKNEEDNLQSLCHSCHQRLTVEMGDRFRKSYGPRGE